VSTAKEEVRKMLDRLPEDATLEEIQYRLFVRQKIERAMQQAEAGETLSMDEAEQRLSKWLEQ
jgi:predicted transcriptional regulator